MLPAGAVVLSTSSGDILVSRSLRSLLGSCLPSNTSLTFAFFVNGLSIPCCPDSQGLCGSQISSSHEPCSPSQDAINGSRGQDGAHGRGRGKGLGFSMIFALHSPTPARVQQRGLLGTQRWAEAFGGGLGGGGGGRVTFPLPPPTRILLLLICGCTRRPIPFYPEASKWLLQGPVTGSRLLSGLYRRDGSGRSM